MWAGVLYGFAAALFQSLSYLGSKWFFQRGGRSPLRLLAASHVMMGLALLVVLAVLRPADLPPVRTYVLPLLGTSLFYLAGQAGLFLALHGIDSSRVAPLLGFKIVVLACLTTAFFGGRLVPAQWGAVAMSVTAVLLLNEAGGRIPLPSLLGVAGAVLGYSLSDLNIVRLVAALEGIDGPPAVVAVCGSYVVCGVLAGGLAVRERIGWRTCALALPHSVSWFLAMMFLFASFHIAGVVLGNILQSTRGLISIGLGAWVVRLGMLDIERRVSPAVFWKRAAGAALMMAAIVVYLRAG